MLPGWWGVGSVTALSAQHPPARMISPSGNTPVWGSPLGLLFFRLWELNQHSYPTGPFSCLPHSPACSLNSLSTVPTNFRERFGGEKNQPAQMRAGENTHGDGRPRLLLLAQLDRCPGGPSSSWARMERGKERFSSSFLFFMFFPYFSVSPFFSLPISCFLFLFHSAFTP